MTKLTRPQWINTGLLAVMAAMIGWFLTIAYGAERHSEEATEKAVAVATELEAFQRGHKEFRERILESLARIEKELDK